MTAPAGKAGEGATFARGAMGGVPWMVASKFLLFFVYFGISVITVRLLGPEKYGVYSICKSMAEFGVLFGALGLNSALIRFIPELVVETNRAGLRRLLWKAGALQAGAALLATAALVAAAPLLDRMFGVRFGLLLPVVGLLAAALLSKDFFNDTLTALFEVRKVVVLSFAQGLLWLGLLLGVRAWRPGVAEVMLAHAFSILLLSAAAAWVLARHVAGLRWRSPPQGIGKERVLRFAIPSFLNALARAVMLRYSEVFFLGAFWGAQVAGVYDLGCSAPFLAITFIPMAVQTLLSAGFSEAHSRDPACLPRLVDFSYKFLVLLAVPLAVLGVFFAPRAMVLVYGEAMREAGPVASAFCVLHVMPLVSMPLSMAIMAREKVLGMLPLMLLQVAMNLALDALLIPAWGLKGAVAAVALTFVLTIPVRLRAVRRLVGGIWFPTGFLLRVLVPSVLLAGGLRLLTPSPGLPLLAAIGVAYAALLLLAVRLFGLIREADVIAARELGFSRLNRALDLLLGSRA
jgi:O-antigen/teichoic acid export membrane protein